MFLKYCSGNIALESFESIPKKAISICLEGSLGIRAYIFADQGWSGSELKILYPLTPLKSI